LALTPGTRLGPYEVVSAIGAGGMGEVYRATDTKLKRQVAIKILPAALAADRERLLRFQREAEVLASLNHPNIAAIYGLEESGGVSALVMELVEGEDLSQRVARGAITLDEALPYARQIAEALEAAHEQGIVHRDLKPANIKVRADGTAKVLDFGLAKALEPTTGSSPNVSQTPTLTTPAMTQAGTIMGTTAYMSPEQARGRPVDRRTDIWAFGCVLYEMLTGGSTFSRETVTDTLSAITRDEPDWNSHPDIPPHIKQLLRRCLDKDPRTRLRDIGEARIALTGSSIGDGAGTLTNAESSRRGRLGVVPWAVALLLAFTASGVTWWIALRRPAPDGQSLGPTLTHVTADSGLTTSPTVAPNGSLLAYASDRGGGSMNIWVQPLPDGQPIQITHGNEDATEPDFSPDGSRIVFRSERNGGGIYVVPALGGGERFVAPKGRLPRFSPDGKSIAYVTGGRGASTEVWIVDDGGASPRRLEVSEFDARDWVAPLWSPDGAFLAVAANRGRGTATISDWWLINVQSGAATAMSTVGAFERAGLSSNTGPAAWVNGEILFSATTGDVSSLWAIGVSTDGRTVTGLPLRLTAGVGTDGEPSVARGVNDRTFYYANKDERANVYRLSLTGSKSAGSLERVTDAAASDLWPSVSADGRTLVFASNRSSGWGTWTRDLASGRETSLTSTGGEQAVVSSDGRRVSYSSVARRFPPKFVTRPIDGGATESLPGDLTYVWSWPSQTVMFGSGRVGDIEELRVVDPSSGKVRPALTDLKQGFYGHGQLSPDGRWASAMEWSSADRARIIIFPVRAAPVPPAEWIALTEDQSVEEEHVWSPQGDAIYFVSERDGNRCVWMRKLDPATKRPVGPVIPVLHLHGARRSMISTALRPQRIALAVNNLFFSVQEQRGNIWKATFRAH
jgi:Tol biopolymer transport system component